MKKTKKYSMYTDIGCEALRVGIPLTAKEFNRIKKELREQFNEYLENSDGLEDGLSKDWEVILNDNTGNMYRTYDEESFERMTRKTTIYNIGGGRIFLYELTCKEGYVFR